MCVRARAWNFLEPNGAENEDDKDVGTELTRRGGPFKWALEKEEGASFHASCMPSVARTSSCGLGAAAIGAVNGLDPACTPASSTAASRATIFSPRVPR